MNIIVKKIKIQNFRSLRSVVLELDDCTMLVGKNNSGKSNIIQAIGLAFDFSNILKEDIFVSPDEPFNEDKKVIVDVKVLPLDNGGKNSWRF